MSFDLTYSVINDLGENVDLTVFRAAVEPVVTPAIEVFSQEGDVVTITLASEPVQGEKDAADAEAVTHAAGAVQRARDTRMAEIETRTAELTAAGFVFSTKTFSLSAKSQRLYLCYHSNRTALSYPVALNTRDNQDTHSLADAAAVVTFFEAFVLAVRAFEDAEMTIKDLIRAAVTVVAVNAVVDNR